MSTIQREDANHILRSLTAKIEWIAKTYCLHCQSAALAEMHLALETAETDLWALKDVSS